MTYALFLRFCLFILCNFNCYLSAAVSSGTSLWYVAAQLGSNTDQIAQTISTDTAGTFTILQTISNQVSTIQSNIDALQTVLTNDFDSTFTTLQTINNQAITISSVIDLLDDSISTNFAGTFTVIDTISFCGCAVLLSLSSTGTTLSSSGIYCLNDDVVLTDQNDIKITGTDVVLDLSGHTIYNGDGINISGDRVIIKNGNLEESKGISTQYNSNIDIENISTFSCDIGIYALATTNLFIKNVVASLCVTSGISLNSSTNCDLQNCTVSNQSGLGFDINSSTCISLTNCMSDSNTTGFLVASSTACIFNTCYACNNQIEGFSFAGTTQNSSLFNCTAVNNVIGFNINAPLILKSCQAISSNNAMSVGFNIIQSSLLVDCQAQGYNSGFSVGNQSSVIVNCSAENNSNGFIMGTSLDNLMTDCTAFNNIEGFNMQDDSHGIIEKSTADQNNSGFLGNLSSIIFYLNNAVDNTTNFNILAGTSSPVSTLTSASRLYGDNLENM